MSCLTYVSMEKPCGIAYATANTRTATLLKLGLTVMPPKRNVCLLPCMLFAARLDILPLSGFNVRKQQL